MPVPLPSPFEAILFDLDGTLVDSVEDIASSANHVRRQMGLDPLPSQTIRTYVGDGVRILFERALETRETSVIDQAVALWRPYYLEHCLDHTHLYPGVLEMIRQLQAWEMPMAVVTNKPLSPSEVILDGLGIRGMFASVVGGDSAPKRKPDPDPFLLAIRQMNLDSPHALVVGDSPNDVRGAHHAGFASCGVLWGIGHEIPLRESHPHFIAQTPWEILERIKSQA